MTGNEFLLVAFNMGKLIEESQLVMPTVAAE